MSRLNTENIVGVGPVVKTRSAPSAFDLFSTDTESFGQHLQRAVDSNKAATPTTPTPSSQVPTTPARDDTPSASMERTREEDDRDEREDCDPVDRAEDASRDVGPNDRTETARDTTDAEQDDSAETTAEAADDGTTGAEGSKDAQAEKNEDTEQSSEEADNADDAAEVVVANLPAEEVVEEGQSEDAKAEQDADAVKPTDANEQDPSGKKSTGKHATAMTGQTDEGTATTEQTDASDEQTVVVDKQSAKGWSKKSGEAKADSSNEATTDDVVTGHAHDEEQPKNEAAPTGEQTTDPKTVVESTPTDAGPSQHEDRHNHREQGKGRQEKQDSIPTQKADTVTTQTPATQEKVETPVQVVASVSTEPSATDSGAKPGGNPTGNVQSPGQGHAAGQSGRAAPANATPEGESVDTTDRVRFVQRITRAMNSAAQQDGTMRMRLHPAELGSMRLEITMRNGAMIARIETDTQEARNLLLDNLPALRERLSQQNIKVQQFDVDYQSGGDGRHSPEGPDDRSGWSGGSRGGSQRNAPEQSQREAVAATPSSQRVAAPGQGSQLDVLV
ncbi:MAG: flagellar hook-length control protein FliK [Pirellulales bacterium]|nr:flagellar hook-length control protein FliK [Pirellulales bacterium]